MSHAKPATSASPDSQPSKQHPSQTAKPPKRSLRVPKRARLGDMPLLRRVGNELAYTPTRCRVMASAIPMRRDPWWERLPSAEALAAAARAQRAFAGKILPETLPNPTR